MLNARPLVIYGIPSLPMRGAWIEISNQKEYRMSSVSLPMRGAWIEMRPFETGRKMSGSLPMRGAWIEIAGARQLYHFDSVAPHAGSVD